MKSEVWRRLRVRKKKREEILKARDEDQDTWNKIRKPEEKKGKRGGEGDCRLTCPGRGRLLLFRKGVEPRRCSDYASKNTRFHE